MDTQKIAMFKGSYLFQTIILGINVGFRGRTRKHVFCMMWSESERDIPQQVVSAVLQELLH